MTFMPSLARVPIAGAGALLALLGTVSACSSSTPTSAAMSAGQTPVLLTCPVGQQPLLRQAIVNGSLVPQVECVSAQAAGVASVAPSAPVAQPLPAAWSGVQAPAPTALAPTYVPARMTLPPPQHASTRPAPRPVVYDDDVVEYRPRARRSVKKSALIIGSSAGIGAGVGAATGGKKGALIGAAVGGGAAAVWDQMTRRD